MNYTAPIVSFHVGLKWDDPMTASLPWVTRCSCVVVVCVLELLSATSSWAKATKTERQERHDESLHARNSICHVCAAPRCCSAVEPCLSTTSKTSTWPVCVCVDHLHRCKTSFGCSGFSTLCLQGVAADHLGPLPTKTPIWSGDTDWDANLRTCTNFHFRQWRPAKPSTGMSFGFFHFPLWIMLHLNLLQNFGVNRFHPLYGFRNLNYCWLR